MITYNNKDILKSFIGNKRVIKKYLNNKIVYGIPDFAQYYNIQGYDNYEVVGNPTIVDGVASGFSANDYFSLVHPTVSSANYVEVGCKFTTGDTISQQGICGASVHFSKYGFFIRGTNGILRASVRINQDGTDKNVTVDSSISLLANNTYYAIMSCQKSSHILTLKLSTDGQNWTTTTTDVGAFDHFVAPSKVYFIGKTQNGVFEGSIDLNNTYIKVNGEYCFNGNSNYKELLDCNPNVYLKNINTSYVDTNYIPSKYTRIKFNFKIDNVREISPNTRNWIMGASTKYRVMNNFYVGFWQRSDTSAAFWPNSTNLDVAQYITYVWELNKKYFVDFKGSSAVADDAYTDLYDENGNRKFHVLNSNTDDIDMLGKTLLLFIRKDNVNSPNAYFLGSLYAIQIYERNVLKMNLIPVPQGLQIGSYKVPSNGMFDIVEQKFYANAGSGEFIWGVDL